MDVLSRYNVVRATSVDVLSLYNRVDDEFVKTKNMDVKTAEGDSTFAKAMQDEFAENKSDKFVENMGVKAAESTKP